MNDSRPGTYQHLHQGQLKTQEDANRLSADCILGIVWEYLQPNSVLDVGCGLGTWLAAVQRRGVTDVRGIDGPWLTASGVACDPALVQISDLETGFDLSRRFDLLICLEVAEHLSPEAADRFVASLVKHSSSILFSAAIPFQGGHHHVNEQFLPYWVERFARHGYQPLDVIRGRIWDDMEILWWLRQNVILFVHEDLIAANERLRDVGDDPARPISVVHPDIYMSRMHRLYTQLDELQRFQSILRKGGVFRTAVDRDGRLNVTKIRDR